MSISRVYRILRLITILQSRSDCNVDDLAEELGVSRRTVFRDLNMLEMAHIPYYYDPDTSGYRISRHFFLPPVNLTVTEALAMMLLAGRMRSTTHLPLLSEASRAALKLENALPGAIRRDMGTVMDKVSLAAAATSRHEGIDEVFETLTEAITDRRVCRLVYISFHERKQIATDIRPLRLTFRQRAWYVLAHSAVHGQVRTFKLGRIRKLTPTDETFDEPDEVDEQAYFGRAWNMIPEGRCYDVHLHFDPIIAGNVAEVQWHETQRVEWNDDGSAEFRATVDGLGEITWWVLGYGDKVEVVSPEALRRRVAERASRAAARNGREAAS
ncbi:MAG: helix-turn-helix transcriptional regulator [Planctomycetota bacterium]